MTKSPLGNNNLLGNLDNFQVSFVAVDAAAIVPTKLGLNSTLNKQLKMSVSAVSPKVVAVRKSFEAVGLIVERFSNDGRDVQLIKDWRSIEEDYTAFLEESSELAIAGANIIHDFLESVLPYLNSMGNLDDKCRELKAYCETLKEGENQARKFSKTLELVATHVVDFKDQWQQRVEEVIEELKESISRLESELSELARSIRDVKGNVSELKMAKLDKAEKEKLKRSQQQEAQYRAKTDKQVAKHADAICTNTDGLRVVWNLIYDDLYLIEAHLRVTASGKGHSLFQQRLAKLPEQYGTLKDALEKYSLALAMKPGNADERSFFGKLRAVFH